jgi:hypothetical protein
MALLSKYHGYLGLIETAPGANTYEPDSNSNGWEQVQSIQTFVSSVYIDLAGLSKDNETVFFNGITTQEAQPISIASAAAAPQGNSVLVYDIVTSIPINWQTIDTTAWAFHGIGFPGSILNFEHVLYHRLRRYTLDIDHAGAFALPMTDEQAGSLQPTASDRLYCYRLVTPFPFTGITQVSIPPVRYVAMTSTKKEQEYQYLMRLKKSYDLQQSFDVDGNRPH